MLVFFAMFNITTMIIRVKLPISAVNSPKVSSALRMLQEQEGKGTSIRIMWTSTDSVSSYHKKGIQIETYSTLLQSGKWECWQCLGEDEFSYKI
jgi:hypothetical protein